MASSLKAASFLTNDIDDLLVAADSLAITDPSAVDSGKAKPMKLVRKNQDSSRRQSIDETSIASRTIERSATAGSIDPEPTPDPTISRPPTIIYDTMKPKKLRRKSTGQHDLISSTVRNSAVMRPSTAGPSKIQESTTPSTPEPSTPNSGTRAFKQHRYSLRTMERSIAAKIYFEHYFDRIYSGKSSNPTASSSRTRRKIQVEQELDRLGISDAEKSRIRQEWVIRETAMTRLSREKISVNKFEAMKPLGKGAFGFVQLVKERFTGKVYAMKILKKEDMLRGNHESHVRAERDMLSDAASDESCKWLVKLIYSFQDFDQLYFVMEYLPGGDLLSLLIQFDTFPEEMARFYAAEMVLCIEETHKLGYLHRDIKPDNFLVDSRGHLRLGDCGLATDFHWSHETQYYEALRHHAYEASSMPEDQFEDGKCKIHPTSEQPCECVHRWRHNNTTVLEKEKQELDDYITSFGDSVLGSSLTEAKPRLHGDSDDYFNNIPADHKILTWRARTRLSHMHERTYSIVGTNNYISPEMLSGTSYDYSCDWWSLGVIIFEMLYGYPPFASKTREGTRLKIIEFKKWLKFPNYVTRKEENGFGYGGEVSRDGRDIILRLLSEQSDRIGSVASLNAKMGVSEENSASFTNSLTLMLLGKDSQEIKKHHWFKSIDFANITQSKAPWTPELSSEMDTKYFDETVQQTDLQTPFNAIIGKTNDEVQSKWVNQLFQGRPEPDMGDSSDGSPQRLEPITSSDPSDETSSEIDTSQPTRSTIDLRKKLAFVGFTYKGVAGAATRLEMNNIPPEAQGNRPQSRH